VPNSSTRCARQRLRIKPDVLEYFLDRRRLYHHGNEDQLAAARATGEDTCIEALDYLRDVTQQHLAVGIILEGDYDRRRATSHGRQRQQVRFIAVGP